jgi:2-dehydropantoate 2-reductase
MKSLQETTVAIVGAGAVGGWLGALLARAGVPVSALARGATATALRAHGFRLDMEGERVSGPVRVAEDAHALGPHDVVVIAVKAQSLPALAPSLGPLLGPETMVLTAMNGVPWWFFHGLPDAPALRLEAVDPGGGIAAAIPAARVIGGVVHVSCAAPEPGLARHGFGKRIIVGEPDGSQSARVASLAALLGAAGIEVPVSRRIQTDVWYKLWGNMTMNPVSALTGATSDRILDDPLVTGFCLAAMREAAAIGARIGCPITQSGEERNKITRELGAMRTSMLQDIEAGKPLELDALVAAVREIGLAVDVPTPTIDALLGLARLKARVRGLYPP